MKSIRIEHDGIYMFLGTLEYAIMCAIWQGASNTPKIVHLVRQQYKTKDGIEPSYSTVSTTLYRLADEGHVTREGTRNNYYYKPVHKDLDAFTKACITRTFIKILTTFPSESKHVLKALFVKEDR